MHELGVVFYIIDQVEETARKYTIPKVSRITVQLGEVSTVIPSYLKDCYAWASRKHELTKDSELEIEMIEAITHCDSCGNAYPTVQYGRICPHCGSERTWLLQGNECIIKEIEVCN